MRSAVWSGLFAAMLVAACSGSTVGINSPDSGDDASPDAQPDASPDTSTDDASDGSTCTSPPINCGCCDQLTPSTTCENGQWVCPLIECPACAIDAGCPELPPIKCANCCGDTLTPECLNGQWECPLVLCPICSVNDGGPQEASTDGATCAGPAPLICDGCCGTKYAADRCVNGTWECTPRGIACVACDAGLGSADAGSGSADAASSTACAGSAPACLGTDITQCCARDPWSISQCVNGQWMCGSMPAPGCDGTYCIP